MSVVAPQGTDDMASAGSTFSYAQAAKGQSPSQSATPSVGKSVSDVSEASLKNEVSHQHSESTDSSKTLVNKAIPSKQDHLMESDSAVNGTSHEETSQSSQASGPTQQSNATSRDISTSRSHSPTSASASAAVAKDLLPKDEDVFATHNESDSTWDKISQESQNGDKQAPKTEGDDDDTKLTSWEHVPAPKQLKEAPPPSFNIWQKRAQDLKTTKPAQSHAGTNGNGTTRSSEDGKYESKKRTNASRSNTEDKYNPFHGKDSSRGDVRSRGVDEEKGTLRSLKSPASGKSSAAPLPPSTDAMSWPTPDLSKDEEKKKTQDRNEKSEPEKTPSKPHVKEKWVQMPYVPTAVFNTPLPTPGRSRGGPRRGGGRETGGRGGHAMNGSVSGERTPSNTNQASPSVQNGSERSRGDMGPPKPGPLPPRQKRASSVGATAGRDSRRTGDEKADDSSQRGLQRAPASDSRRISSATQTEGAPGRGSPPERRSHDSSRDPASQDFGPVRDTGRRSDVGSRPQEFMRDQGSYTQSRERGDVRAERGGRGGFRGRSGHNNGFGSHSVNGQSFNSGSGSASIAQGYTPSKSQTFTEPRHSTQVQTPYGSHRRTNSRSQSITNPAGYGRYQSNGAPQGPQALPQLQTDAANMYYHQAPPGVMSAMPFTPSYMESMQVASMVQMQMEYYFSLDNLVKDMFLRKHMDSQGFVFLSVLLNFNRIKQLSNDAELIRGVCWRSPQIEFQTGGDGIDRIRKAQDWKQWILTMEDRDPSAQNDGPAQLFQPQLPAYGPPSEMSRGPVGSGSASSSFTPTQYRQEPTMANGHNSASTQISDAHISQTPLSAAVPDFTPAFQSSVAQTFGALETPTESAFSDEQIETLTIVVRKQRGDASLLKSPPSSASRTFSNGSLDPHNISNELSGLELADQQPTATTNGDHAPESQSRGSSERSKSPSATRTPFKQPGGAAPPVYWVKDRDAPIDDLPNDLTHELYTSFRREAMRQREFLPVGQAHHDLEILFQFWSHFLIRNFNAGMYKEFRYLAIEDAMNRGSTIGMRNLITYYVESLLNSKPVSDTIARDYAELVKSEFGSESKDRPAFDKLRATLRNGALPLKNRVKVTGSLDANIKAELER